MNKKILFAIREIIIVALSGGLPIILAYKLGGIKLLDSTVSSLISPDLLLYYACVLALVFAVFYWFNKMVYIDPQSKKQNVINFIISTLSELSTNILGIFRVVSGLLITFPILVLVVEPESFSPEGLEFIKIGIIGLIEGGVFCWFHSKVVVKQEF